jgi:hypothetical protein
MYLQKLHLSRRAVLKGVGATLALPFLDAMVPALTAQARTAVARKRLACIYVPHGVILDQWTPATSGADFEFKTILKPIEPFRQQVTVVTNLLRPERGVDTNHAGAPSSFLTGVPPKRTAGPDFSLGATLDQVVAAEIGQETTLPSLELATEDFTGLIGDCAPGFSCAYMNTLSWKNETTPLPMEINPRLVFERLFGGGTTREARMARIKTDRSLLDFVAGDLKQLSASIGARDKARLDEYTNHVREIERRVQLAERRTDSLIDVPEAPVGVPEAFEDHIKLMYDLQVLAYQAEITRISTMMYARDTSGAVYPASGVRDGFHTASHHSNQRTRMDTYAQINRYHVQMLGYFLEKLKATPDGDGTLLDHSVVLYGSSMSNGNQHDHDPLPILVAGGASGQLKGDRHLVFPAHTPMSNLMLSLLDKLGVHQDRFGDSTGKLEI